MVPMKNVSQFYSHVVRLSRSATGGLVHVEMDKKHLWKSH